MLFDKSFGGALIFPDVKMPLHTMLRGYGYEVQRSPAYRWDGMKRGTRSFAIWQHTLSGCGMLQYGDKQFEVPRNHSMLLHIPHGHRYFFRAKDGHWQFIFLNFSGSEALRLLNEIETSAGPVFAHAGNSPLVSFGIRMIRDADEKGIDNPFVASRLAYEFIMRMAEETNVDVRRSPDRSFRDFLSRYCVDRMDRRISVGELAGAAGLSRFHFSRKFAEILGTPPSQFVSDLKMRQAVRLLQTEFISVKDLAARCGFDDPSYFCRTFKRHYGASPEQFRRGKLSGKDGQSEKIPGKKTERGRKD